MLNTMTSHPGEHILIVDDNSDASESLNLLLELLGYEVEVAEKVGSVRKAIASHPEVAVIELKSSSDHGFDLAVRLRAKLGRAVLLIAYSAYEMSIRERVRAAGFDHLHVKGHDPFELVRWVEAKAERGRY